MMKRRALYLSLGGLMAPLLATAPIHAQAQQATAAAATEPQAEDGLSEIVVTAEKRESTVQKTAVAMSAFTPEVLAANGATDLRSLQNLAPTLQIAVTGGNTLVTVRGVSSRDFTEIGDPAVAISTDNFYIQRAAALNAGMFDIERVEVLRGPQGTLYGRNATGGAINITSVKPKLGRTEGFIAGEYGNYNTLKVEGGVTLPLGDKVAIRASFLSSSHDGYSKNINVANGDDDNTKGARLHLYAEPTDRLSILVTGEYGDVSGVGPVAQTVPYVTVNGVVSHDYPTIPSRQTWALDTRGSLDITTKSVRGEIAYDLDFMKISYFGGYRNFVYHRFNDGDGGATALKRSFPQNEDEDTQNHELRLSSNGSGPLTWQAGLYYFKESNVLLSQFANVATVPQTDLYYFSYDVGAKSKAAFAQLGYQITDQLQVEGGVRYTKDSKYRTGYNIINGTRTNQNSRTNDDKVTWHAGVNFQATPSNLIYAKADSGYKAGGFTDLAGYGPESLTAYEVGSKNRFMGNTIQLNASAFYYDWTGLQVSQFRADGRSLIVNAGQAEIYGGELEGIVLPVPQMQIDANVAYLHARYTDFAVAVGGVNVPYDGNYLPQSPSWSLSGGVQYDVDTGDGTLTARAQSRFQTKSYFTYRNFGSEMEKSYTKTDITLTYAPLDAGWTLMGYIRNIENRRTIANAGESGLYSGYVYQFSEPRTIGARLTYRF